ncbi:hypothetical protein K9857_16625 [Pseudomonas sp. REP124]|uniref:hypothetical protein n=1 Tax=Pseudomonas sp. REP124 TaxID=2875731 RepID=UPI001CCF8D27|nr:hypothetical protein [Pseudomonas sp. REP124]MBZ9783155.1 hypothetical protein [Pseudomonas sp. REP124]
MEIIPIEQRLKREGLEPPRLNALQADDTLYTVLAHQPSGRIRVAPDSIGHADIVEAKQRTAAFLQLAATTGSQPDIAVSPEYSVPWEALLEAIEQGVVPEEGKLWVLGCESLTLGGLDAIRQRLGERAIVLDDDVSPGVRTTQQYRNPLVYVFLTKCSTDMSTRLVLLVQYKTEPSGDPQNTEATGMLPGICIYAFGTLPSEVRLITLICSDVFGFRQDLIDQYYNGLLLLHIQLNNSPRHLLYKKYRQELFAAAGETELLCLNWAENVVSVDENNTNEHPWKNICGSAWYLCSPETNLSDDAILENHRHGIYYTRHEPIRAHALQFHYRPRVFLFQATKVFHHAIPKPRSMRTGPKALMTFVWAQDQNGWVQPRTPGELPDDGFCEQLNRISAAGIELSDLHELYRTGPIAVERAIAITAGQFGVPADWHTPSRIDSMRLCEHEVVRRITVTQDPAAEAVAFRDGRFALMGAVAELRASGYVWPSSVEALRKGFKFKWLPRFPNRNVVAEDGTMATVVHAGLVVDPQVLDRLDQKVRKTLAGPPPEPERELSHEQEKQLLNQHYANRAERFCIIYATGTGPKNYLSGRDISFTRQSGQSAVDIGVPSFTQFAGPPPGAQE